MYQSDFDAFQELIKDLCAAHDRPPTDERVRAYWDALKPFPFAQIKAQIKAHIANGKEWPRPVELKPPKDEKSAPSPADVIDRLTEYVLRNYVLTPRQHLGCMYLHRLGDPCVVVGMVIPADGDRPGYRVMVEDMKLDHEALR